MIIFSRNIPKTSNFRCFSTIKSKRNQFKLEIEDYSLSLYPISPSYSINNKYNLNREDEHSEDFEELSEDPRLPIIQKNETFLVHDDLPTPKESIMDLKFDNSRPMIEYLEMKGLQKEVLIIGTNHHLNFSSLQTLQYLKRFKPDTCVLELCYSRLSDMYNFYEALSEKKITNVVEKNKFPNYEGFEFIVPLIYSDYINNTGTDMQIIPGDMDYNTFDGLMMAAHSQCLCKDKPSYFDMKQFEINVKMKNTLGLKVSDQELEDMKYKLQGKHCVSNKINLRRELRLMDSIINYSRGPSVMAVVGITHLERLKELLKIYEEEQFHLSRLSKLQIEEILLDRMVEYTECK